MLSISYAIQAAHYVSLRVKIGHLKAGKNKKIAKNLAKKLTRKQAKQKVQPVAVAVASSHGNEAKRHATAQDGN